MARSMLKAKGLSNQFWAEAVATSVYLLNLSPTKAVLNQTPYEAWKSRKPDVSHLRVFGCIAYALVNSHARQKLDEKSQKCIFIGYCIASKAYRLYDPVTGSILIKRDVIFDENASWDFSENNEQVQKVPMSMQQVALPDEVVNGSETNNVSPVKDNVFSPRQTSDETPRKFRPLMDVYEACQFALAVSDPLTYEEASEKEEWRKAMTEELLSIEKNKTWELVDLPEGKKAIGLRWVFKKKLNADGSLQKHKARLVAKGYAQQQGIDFEETFSPVARFETVRTVLALAAQLQWPVYQLDVKSAFLNGDLKEEVFVTQPEGFIRQGYEAKVYRLIKALYGLKQASRAWYTKIDNYFQQNNYRRSDDSEPTLYVKNEGTDFIIVSVYVDDIIYTSSSKKLLDEFKQHMESKFEMSDLGLLHYFLGIEVQQSIDGIFISQRKYAKDLLSRFGMLNSKPADTPMNFNEKLQQDDGAEMADAKKFRSLVGGLNYLTHTRPDIAYSVSLISRFMQQPSRNHFGAAKRVLRYIAGTMEYGIMYSKVPDLRLCGFTDSDWASSLDDRKSVSASVFTLGSGVITWSSKKQPMTALSSTEAEYVAATSAACQAIWLRRLLAEVNQEQEGATEIFCDNVAAISMSKNPAFHSRTKHIDIRHHFIRDLVAEGKITLEYCSTHEQVADILTKSLSKEKFCYFRSMMGVRKFELREGVEY